MATASGIAIVGNNQGGANLLPTVSNTNIYVDPDASLSVNATGFLTNDTLATTATPTTGTHNYERQIIVCDYLLTRTGTTGLARVQEEKVDLEDFELILRNEGGASPAQLLEGRTRIRNGVINFTTTNQTRFGNQGPGGSSNINGGQTEAQLNANGRFALIGDNVRILNTGTGQAILDWRANHPLESTLTNVFYDDGLTISFNAFESQFGASFGGGTSTLSFFEMADGRATNSIDNQDWTPWTNRDISATSSSSPSQTRGGVHFWDIQPITSRTTLLVRTGASGQTGQYRALTPWQPQFRRNDTFAEVEGTVKFAVSTLNNNPDIYQAPASYTYAGRPNALTITDRNLDTENNQLYLIDEGNAGTNGYGQNSETVTLTLQDREFRLYSYDVVSPADNLNIGSFTVTGRNGDEITLFGSVMTDIITANSTQYDVAPDVFALSVAEPGATDAVTTGVEIYATAKSRWVASRPDERFEPTIVSGVFTTGKSIGFSTTNAYASDVITLVATSIEADDLVTGVDSNLLLDVSRVVVSGANGFSSLSATGFINLPTSIENITLNGSGLIATTTELSNVVWESGTITFTDNGTYVFDGTTDVEDATLTNPGTGVSVRLTGGATETSVFGDDGAPSWVTVLGNTLSVVPQTYSAGFLEVLDASDLSSIEKVTTTATGSESVDLSSLDYSSGDGLIAIWKPSNGTTYPTITSFSFPDLTGDANQEIADTPIPSGLLSPTAAGGGIGTLTNITKSSTDNAIQVPLTGGDTTAVLGSETQSTLLLALAEEVYFDSFVGLIQDGTFTTASFNNLIEATGSNTTGVDFRYVTLASGTSSQQSFTGIDPLVTGDASARTTTATISTNTIDFNVNQIVTPSDIARGVDGSNLASDVDDALPKLARGIEDASFDVPTNIDIE